MSGKIRKRIFWLAGAFPYPVTSSDKIAFQTHNFSHHSSISYPHSLVCRRLFAILVAYIIVFSSASQSAWYVSPPYLYAIKSRFRRHCTIERLDQTTIRSKSDSIAVTTSERLLHSLHPIIFLWRKERR